MADEYRTHAGMAGVFVINKKNLNTMGATADKLKGNWNQVKGKLKQKYGDLTDDDLTYAEGKEDELIGRIQEKTGESKDRIKSYIDSL